MIGKIISVALSELESDSFDSILPNVLASDLIAVRGQTNRIMNRSNQAQLLWKPIRTWLREMRRKPFQLDLSLWLCQPIFSVWTAAIFGSYLPSKSSKADVAESQRISNNF